MPPWDGAVERIRTFDRLVNSQPLYRAEPRRHIIMLTALFRFNIVFKYSHDPRKDYYGNIPKQFRSF